MTVLMCLWGLMASLAAWWWRPIQLAKRRVRLGSRVLAWFMNSSSPVCRSRRSPPPTLLSCICIVVPLKQRWLMKIRNRIQTVGVAIRQAVKKSGKSCLNGSGTSDWSWAINCSLIRCVPPSLLLLSRLRTRSPPNLPRRLLFRDTDRVLLHPLAVGSQPIFWRDWSRRHHRRMCMQLLRHQRVEVQVEFGNSAPPTVTSVPLSRAQRAHYRLDWSERLARNARVPTASQVTLRLFGVPEGFATPLSLMTA